MATLQVPVIFPISHPIQVEPASLRLQPKTNSDSSVSGKIFFRVNGGAERAPLPDSVTLLDMPDWIIEMDGVQQQEAQLTLKPREGRVWPKYSTLLSLNIAFRDEDISPLEFRIVYLPSAIPRE